MIRHDFSYWMKIQAKGNTAEFPKTLQDMINALSANDCLWPNGPFVLDIQEQTGLIISEVYPQTGTVEEDSDLPERLEKAARACPNTVIEMRALDEEDKSNAAQYLFVDGKKVLERHARLVPCDRTYDNITVQKIADFLEGNGHKQLAKDVLLNFSEV